MDGLLFQATIYLVAAVIAVPIAARLGLGSVLGYLLAGLVIGPVLGLIGTETTDLQHFAEFGVVMMLFLIGLEMNPQALWDMRHRMLGLGGLQISVTIIIIAAGAVVLGRPVASGIAVGMIFALSSTAIVLQTLSEKGLMRTRGGRSTFSVLLTQDIAVIPMLVLLPLLAGSAPPSLGPDGSVLRPQNPALPKPAEAHHDAPMSLVEGLPGWGATLVTLAAVVSVVLAGIYLIRPLFRFIHAAHLREMYTAFSLLIVIGIALLMTLVGLSPALGTFLAGVVLANSEFKHELESDIEPFKGLLLGLFFIAVGAGINLHFFLSRPFTLLGLALGMMLIKGVVLYIVGGLFKLKGRDHWLFTLGLAQAGEFGFVLISFSQQQGVITPATGQVLLLVTALSMLLTPLFFIVYDWLHKRMAEDVTTPDADQIDPEGPIIIAGVGRFGQTVNRMVQMSGFRTTVLDHDLPTIQLMRKFGYRGYFGDPTRPEVLRAAGLAEASCIVVALDDPDATTRLVSYVKRERPDLHVVARARDRDHVYALYKAGADDIVREMFDSSLRAGRYVLENQGLTDYEADALERTYYDFDRSTLKELAELWKPGVPLDQNAEYMARSRELQTELEAALVAQAIRNAEEKKSA